MATNDMGVNSNDINLQDDGSGTSQQAPWWITQDYWAPDRAQVLADPTRWGTDPTQKQTTQTPPTPTGDFWDQLFKSGGKNSDDLTKFLTDSGWGSAGYKQSGKKGDMITDPTGHSYDAIYASGDPSQSHYQKFDPSAASNAGYSAATGSATPSYGPGVQDAITKLLTRGFSTPTGDDPEIAAQFAPTSKVIDRGTQRARQQAAERAGATGALVGGEGGGFDSVVNGINEHGTDQKATAMGGLIGNEVQARRQDIVNALQFAQGEEKMALEKQLADADNEIRREGLSQQNSQFYDNLGFQIGQSGNQDDTLAKLIQLLG